MWRTASELFLSNTLSYFFQEKCEEDLKAWVLRERKVTLSFSPLSISFASLWSIGPLQCSSRHRGLGLVVPILSILLLPVDFQCSANLLQLFFGLPRISPLWVPEEALTGVNLYAERQKNKLYKFFQLSSSTSLNISYLLQRKPVDARPLTYLHQVR